MPIAYVAVAVALAAAVAARFIWAKQQERSRSASTLVFPREVRPEQVVTFLTALSGRIGETFTVEITATTEGIVHRLVAPRRAAEFVANQLRAAIPGVRLVPDEERPVCALGWELQLSDPSVPLRTDDPAGTSAAILASLAGDRSPGVVVQWTLTPKRRVPLLVLARSRRSPETRLADAIADWLRGRRTVDSSEELHRLAVKAKTPLFRASLRVGVITPGAHEEQVVPVVASISSVRNPGVEFRRRPLSPSLVAKRVRERRIPALIWPVLVNAAEMTALAGWPLDSPIIPGLTVGGTPHLPPVGVLPEKGLVIGRADFPGMERPVAIGFGDALRHLYVPGPTGTGKSTLALNLILQQMTAGYGVCVIDPKGDLINDLLERIPLTREDDVIVVDPTDERPVGLNLLDGPEGEADLTADQVVGVFARRFGSAWGPRTDDIARAAVLTLLADRESTLADLPFLLTNAAFRRSLVGKVADETLLQFWEEFEQWSDAERSHNMAPLLNKLRAVLMRHPVRAVVGQPSTISMDSVLSEGKLMLVSLSAGLLGEDAASLLRWPALCSAVGSGTTKGCPPAGRAPALLLHPGRVSDSRLDSDAAE